MIKAPTKPRQQSLLTNTSSLSNSWFDVELGSQPVFPSIVVSGFDPYSSPFFKSLSWSSMARIDSSVYGNLGEDLHPLPLVEVRGDIPSFSFSSGCSSTDLSLLFMGSSIESMHSSVLSTTTNEKRTSSALPMSTERARAPEVSNTKTDWIGMLNEALTAGTHQTRATATQTPAEEEPPQQMISSKREPSTQPARNTKPAQKKVPCTVKHPAKPHKSTAASQKNKPRNIPSRRFIPEDKNYVEDDIPTEMDVLSGRGGGSNHHAGNQRYWLKVLELRPAHAACGEGNNEEKRQIAQRVVDHIEENKGRFLERETKKRKLFVLPKDVVLEKVKQALRDKYVPFFAR